ncbi:MAG TPA: hypothetical protein VGI64_13670 [Streptosporangiaceae bacterium]
MPMLKSRFWRGAALVTSVCGLVGAGAGTAVAASAAPATAATVTIAAKSAFTPVTGDTFVEFLGSTTTDAATVSGTVTGATIGDSLTVTLLAGKFGAASPTATSEHVTTVPSSGTASYSFTVRPGLRTSYEVRVTDASGTVGTSGVKTVYVVSPASLSGNTRCTRPVCHIALKVSVKVPISAYATEAAKHFYLYSRLFLAKHGEPAPPKLLELNSAATASKPVKLHTYEFARTIRFTFRIGEQDGYRWAVNFCTQDSETKDGVGLPGRHGCGNHWISADPDYLG